MDGAVRRRGAHHLRGGLHRGRAFSSYSESEPIDFTLVGVELRGTPASLYVGYYPNVPNQDQDKLFGPTPVGLIALSDGTLLFKSPGENDPLVHLYGASPEILREIAGYVRFCDVIEGN
jgi:hypothetical protein